MRTVIYRWTVELACSPVDDGKQQQRILAAGFYFAVSIKLFDFHVILRFQISSLPIGDSKPSAGNKITFGLIGTGKGPERPDLNWRRESAERLKQTIKAQGPIGPGNDCDDSAGRSFGGRKLPDEPAQAIDLPDSIQERVQSNVQEIKVRSAFRRQEKIPGFIHSFCFR